MKNPPASTGDAGSIPGLGGSPGGGNGNPLQYSCLGNPMDRGAWWATVHGITKESDTMKDKSPHTHTHLPLDPLAPWLPNIQISAQSAETQGVPMLPRSLSCEDTSWRFVWRCLIISNSLLSVCVTTWSVSPTLSGWQAHFARGQYHQPLSAWHINQDSWMNKWRWIPLSRFSTSLNDEAVPYPSFCLHLVLLFHVPALSHLCTLSQVPFLYEP